MMHANLTFIRLLLAAVFFLSTNVLIAQQKIIIGKIAGTNGQPIVGATVTAKGTQTATQTNSDGVFSLSVPNRVQRLVVTSVGFASEEVAISGKSNISVALTPSTTQLSEVVVTALGVERNRKSLQASVTTIGGENLTQAREISTANALAGRVAGVNVTRVASGPGGSSRVVIRGAKTLGSTLNQPLYVIDGVPIDNSNMGQAGIWGGSDQGDAMNSVNPDDIASMTVLKGASAAALYGSRAANGVILITTKKGAGRKGLGVEFNSNYVTETVQDLRDVQTTYGSGGMVSPPGMPGLQNQFAKKPENIQEAFNNNWN